MDIKTPVKSIYGDHAQKFRSAWESQVEILRSKFSSAIEETRFPGEYPTDVPIIYVRRDSIVAVLEFLKSEQGIEYDFLSDLTATDETPNDKRFEVVYNLFSYTKLYRIRVKVRLKENESTPSIVSIWPGANFLEREVWDMYGIKFDGHPDLRRILMDERWEGHPLRKDYPIKGYQIFPTAEPIDPELLSKRGPV